MTTILEILTFAWLVYWAWMAVKLLSRGANHPILYVFLVHLLYCGAPLLLNLLFGRPEYPSLPGINEALDDFPTHMLYCLYVGLCPMVWWKMSHLSSWRPLAKGGGGTPPVLNSTHVFACLTMLLLPFLYLLKVPDPAMYLHYTPGSRELYGRELEAFYHVVMAHLTLGSILGGIFLLMHARRFFYSLLFIAPFLLGACWLNGKRHVVALLVGMIVFLAVDRGYWRGHRFIQRAILSAFALLCFLAVYQYKLRWGDQSVAQRTVQEWYENLRLDLGRDHTIKFSLFCELYSQPGRILDYRGQSLMIYLTAPIPRYFWPEKPASYPYRLTSLAMQMPLQATGGALTTSILDEAISNFWLLGLFIGPWMISWVCQVAEKSHNKYMQAFSVFIVFFMQSTHLLAIYPFAVAWIVLGIRFHVFPSYEFSAGMRPSRSRCRSPVQNRRTL